MDNKLKKIILIASMVIIILALITYAIVSNDKFKQWFGSKNEVSEEGKYVERLNASNFHETIANADKPVLIDYYANWCGPCRLMAPILVEMSEEIDDFYIYKVDTDLDKELFMEVLKETNENGGIPFFVMYNEGEISFTIKGAMNKDDFVKRIYNQLAIRGIEFDND